MRQEITLDTINMSEFNSRVAAANKIAKRLGLASITTEVVAERSVKVHGKKYTKRVADIIIEGEYPAFTGWAFMAKIAHSENMSFSFDGVNRTHMIGDTTCDHCHHDRKRNSTYIVKNEETGEHKHVGGSCLKYYIPTKSLNSLSSFFTAVSDFCDIDSYGGGGREQPTDIHEIYTMMFGYKETFDVAWGSDFKNDMFQLLTRNPNWRDEREAIRESDNRPKWEKQADELIEWARTQDTTNSYWHNVNAMLDTLAVFSKRWNMAFSVFGAKIGADAKERKAQEEKAAKAELPPSEYIGTIKKREEFDLTLDRIIAIEGYYGTTFIHKFHSGENNQVVWFGSKCLRGADGEIVEDGTKVRVKATVKAQEPYEGVKQTNITRVAFVA